MRKNHFFLFSLFFSHKNKTRAFCSSYPAGAKAPGRTATALLAVLGRADARQRPHRRVSGAAAVDACGARWTTTIHSPVCHLIPPAIVPALPCSAPGLCANWAQRLPGSAWPARYQRVQHEAASSVCARDMCASPRVAESLCSPWTRVGVLLRSLRTLAAHNSPTQRRQQPVWTQAVPKRANQREISADQCPFRADESTADARAKHRFGQPSVAGACLLTRSRCWQWATSSCPT